MAGSIDAKKSFWEEKPDWYHLIQLFISIILLALSAASVLSGPYSSTDNGALLAAAIAAILCTFYRLISQRYFYEKKDVQPWAWITPAMEGLSAVLLLVGWILSTINVLGDQSSCRPSVVVQTSIQSLTLSTSFVPTSSPMVITSSSPTITITPSTPSSTPTPAPVPAPAPTTSVDSGDSDDEGDPNTAAAPTTITRAARARDLDDLELEKRSEHELLRRQHGNDDDDAAPPAPPPLTTQAPTPTPTPTPQPQPQQQQQQVIPPSPEACGVQVSAIGVGIMLWASILISAWSAVQEARENVKKERMEHGEPSLARGDEEMAEQPHRPSMDYFEHEVIQYPRTAL